MIISGAGLPVSLPDMVVVEGPKAGGHLGFFMEQLTGKEPLDFDAEIRNITDYVHDIMQEFA